MLYLADSAGGHIRTVKTKLPICDFSVSPDSAKLVFVPCHSTDYGGPLYLLDINAGVLQKLSVGPYWRVASDAPVREVYADPEFSPDNASVVFTVRKVPINGHADLVEASGPLAIMQLGTRHVHLVQSTLNLDGNGPAFANQPHWSPDGATILVSFETGFAVLPKTGTTIRMLEPDSLPNDADWSTAFGWVGNRCILFGAGHDGAVHDTEVLHLESRKAGPVSSLFGELLGGESGINSLHSSGSQLLVGTTNESKLLDTRSRQLLGHFPIGAKLVGTNKPARQVCQ